MMLIFANIQIAIAKMRALLYLIHIIHQVSMDFKDAVYAYLFAAGALICREENKSLLNGINLPHFSYEFPIRSARFQRIRHKVYYRHQWMVAVLDHIVNQRQLLIQQELLAFGQFDLPVCHPARFRNHAIEAGERRKGGKLRRAVMHAHVRAVFRLMMRKRQDVSVGILSFGHHSSPALWPPIWPFRSMVVPPSSRFMPLSMAFFPNLS